MPGPRMQYAKLSNYQYQSFDIDFVKFTNIPLYQPKKKEETPPVKEGEKVEKDETKDEAVGELHQNNSRHVETMLRRSDPQQLMHLLTRTEEATMRTMVV